MTTMKRGYEDVDEIAVEDDDGLDDNLPDLEEVINIPPEAGGDDRGHSGSRCSSLASSSGHSDNFLVMKRRNAFIAVDSVSGVDDEAGLLPAIPPTIRRTRQFSLQF